VEVVEMLLDAGADIEAVAEVRITTFLGQEGKGRIVTRSSLFSERGPDPITSCRSRRAGGDCGGAGAWGRSDQRERHRPTDGPALRGNVWVIGHGASTHTGRNRRRGARRGQSLAPMSCEEPTLTRSRVSFTSLVCRMGGPQNKWRS
jgi:hypothetical protein